MPTYDKKLLETLLDGKLAWDEVQKLHRNKDEDRFKKMVSIWQERVNFKEEILLPLTPHLFIVQKAKDRIVKCDCGHEFGDYRVNWKIYANIYVRDTKEALEEIYPGHQCPDPRFLEVREYYCPNCATLLEVEALAPGMAATFDFLPDIDTFYAEWLKKPLAEKFQYRDKTGDVLKEWG